MKITPYKGLVSLNRILFHQVWVTSVFAILAYAIKGPLIAIAILYGGLTSIALGIFFVLRHRSMTKKLSASKKIHIGSILIDAVWRFLLVLFFFWLGIGNLKLAPFGVIFGFAVCHVLHFVGFFAASKGGASVSESDKNIEKSP